MRLIAACCRGRCGGAIRCGGSFRFYFFEKRNFRLRLLLLLVLIAAAACVAAVELRFSAFRRLFFVAARCLLLFLATALAAVDAADRAAALAAADAADSATRRRRNLRLGAGDWPP